MKITTVLICLLFSFVAFAQLSVGVSVGAALSKSINTEKAYKNSSYDVNSLLQENVNFKVQYIIKRKFTFTGEFGWISLGFMEKDTQGFTPHAYYPFPEPYALHYFDYKRYAYHSATAKLGYFIHPKLHISGGLRVLMHRSSPQQWFVRKVFIVGYYQHEGWLEKYEFPNENLNKVDLAAQLDLQYFLWKGAFVELGYLVGLRPHNTNTDFARLYHHAFLFSAGYQHAFQRKKRKRKELSTF